MSKKSNLKRNTNGSHKGKKCVSPYKYYMDRDKIIALKINRDTDPLFQAVGL